MDKVVKNGKVAIIHSTELGAYWYSVHRNKELIFDPNIVAILEDDTLEPIQQADQIDEYLEEKYGDGWYGDTLNIEVGYIPQGTLFTFDSNDNLILMSELEWLEA